LIVAGGSGVAGGAGATGVQIPNVGTGISINGAGTGLSMAPATQNTSATIAAEGTEARPRNVAMVYCIRAFGALQTDGLGSMAFQNSDAVDITGGSGVFSSLQCTKVPTLPNDVARLADIGNQLADIFSSDPAVLLVDKTNPTNPILRPQTNIPNGTVKLDAAGFVPASVLNITDLTFLGTWDAGPGVLPTGTFVTGDYYTIDGPGTLTLNTSSGSQAVVCSKGDSIIYKTTPTAGWWYQPAATPSNAVIQTSATGAAVIPSGTVGERPAVPVDGYFRYNSTDNVFEGHTPNGWGQVGGGQMYGTAPVKAIFFNSATIGENLTVKTGENGGSFGPVTVNNGFTVTVESGSVWSIV
jgi:hypothetical protein